MLAITLVASAGVVAASQFAIAGSSFLGQGTVPFDRIKVGQRDADKIELNGMIQNSRKNKPVTINDDLSVTGNLLFPNDKKGWIKAPGADNVVGIDDDAQIMGGLTVFGATNVANLNVTGALTAGQYNVGQLIVDTAALASRMGKFDDCVSTFAQLTTYVESSDYIFCWNTWMAGKPVTVLSNSSLTPTQRAQLDKRRAFDAKDPAQLVHEMATGH